jgi:glucan phosphoethanolaminetransferase (alkaline phosphatase superfamily)
MNVEAGQSLILLTFGLVALLSGAASYYFSLFRPRRPAAIALLLLTAFVFWQDIFWGAVYAVAAMRSRLVTFETLARELFWPAFLLGLLGALATGLLFLLIVRRELR